MSNSSIFMLVFITLASASTVLQVSDQKFADKIGTNFSIFPFRNGPTDFYLENVAITSYSGDIRQLCDSSKSIPKFNASLASNHALYIKVITGCYPGTLSRSVSNSGFQILLVGDRYNPAGVSATSIWKFSERFHIPVVQISSDIIEYLDSGSIVNLDPDKSFYQSSRFLGYAIFLDCIFAVLCATQVFLSTDRLYHHLKATNNKFTTSVQVLIMELLEGITKLTMGTLDPFGFFHVLPTPWWRIIVFIGSSVNILTTFLLAFRMHAAIREASNLDKLTWWKYLLIFMLPIGMFVADLIGAVLYSGLESNAGQWALFSAVLYLLSVILTGSYFAYTKFTVLQQLKSSLAKNDKRGLKRMGYFLTVSGISMLLTIITSLMYAIGLTASKDGNLLFISTMLSAIFVTLTGIFHVLALRRYKRKNEAVDNGRFSDGKYVRNKSSAGLFSHRSLDAKRTTMNRSTDSQRV